ncbi:MAG TPA: carboxymuconolactone decarboxylase family protein [Dongiaceae bacterium]|jgi:AhpD family alkylhydroperoxidase|nr:carboxymuconolactone decarboxylase family protein [Dongiaceae bacterium]
MQQRINPKQIAPDAYTAMSGLQAYVNKCGLEHALLELVKMRASQINGCAFCLVMHSTDALKAGESQERLHLLNAWRETDLYTPRERAALAWTEALTLIADSDVSDEVYDEARRHFSDKELVDLGYAIMAINGWNRLMKAFRVPPVISKASAAA